MPVDKFGRMSDTRTKDTGVSLTYINYNYIRSDGNMNGYTLYNVPNPVNPQDVATKEYADEIVSNVSDKRTHIIAVNASYGDLIRFKYQFNFGGNKAYNSTTGFLVPHSGRIRKIKMRTPINKESFEGRIFEKNRADVSFINLGFFVFTNTKINGDLKTIGKITCQDAYKLYFQLDKYSTLDNPEIRWLYEFCFEDDLPLNNEETIIVEEGDIISIRTLIDLSFPNLGEDIEDLNEDSYMGNTYLATFLIELDPL